MSGLVGRLRLLVRRLLGPPASAHLPSEARVPGDPHMPIRPAPELPYASPTPPQPTPCHSPLAPAGPLSDGSAPATPLEAEYLARTLSPPQPREQQQRVQEEADPPTPRETAGAPPAPGGELGILARVRSALDSHGVTAADLLVHPTFPGLPRHHHHNSTFEVRALRLADAARAVLAEVHPRGALAPAPVPTSAEAAAAHTAAVTLLASSVLVAAGGGSGGCGGSALFEPHGDRDGLLFAYGDPSGAPMTSGVPPAPDSASYGAPATGAVAVGPPVDLGGLLGLTRAATEALALGLRAHQAALAEPSTPTPAATADTAAAAAFRSAWPLPRLVSVLLHASVLRRSLAQAVAALGGAGGGLYTHEELEQVARALRLQEEGDGGGGGDGWEGRGSEEEWREIQDGEGSAAAARGGDCGGGWLHGSVVAHARDADVPMLLEEGWIDPGALSPHGLALLRRLQRDQRDLRDMVGLLAKLARVHLLQHTAATSSPPALAYAHADADAALLAALCEALVAAGARFSQVHPPLFRLLARVAESGTFPPCSAPRLARLTLQLAMHTTDLPHEATHHATTAAALLLSQWVVSARSRVPQPGLVTPGALGDAAFVAAALLHAPPSQPVAVPSNSRGAPEPAVDAQEAHGARVGLDRGAHASACAFFRAVRTLQVPLADDDASAETTSGVRWGAGGSGDRIGGGAQECGASGLHGPGHSGGAADSSSSRLLPSLTSALAELSAASLSQSHWSPTLLVTAARAISDGSASGSPVHSSSSSSARSPYPVPGSAGVLLLTALGSEVGARLERYAEVHLPAWYTGCIADTQAVDEAPVWAQHVRGPKHRHPHTKQAQKQQPPPRDLRLLDTYLHALPASVRRELTAAEQDVASFSRHCGRVNVPTLAQALTGWGPSRRRMQMQRQQQQQTSLYHDQQPWLPRGGITTSHRGLLNPSEGEGSNDDAIEGPVGIEAGEISPPSTTEPSMPAPFSPQSGGHDPGATVASLADEAASGIPSHGLLEPLIAAPPPASESLLPAGEPSPPTASTSLPSAATLSPAPFPPPPLPALPAPLFGALLAQGAAACAAASSPRDTENVLTQCRFGPHALASLAGAFAPFAHHAHPAAVEASVLASERLPARPVDGTFPQSGQYAALLASAVALHRACAATSALVLQTVGDVGVAYTVTAETPLHAEVALLHAFGAHGVPHRGLFRALAVRVAAKGSVRALGSLSDAEVVRVLWALCVGWTFEVPDALAVLVKELQTRAVLSQQLTRAQAGASREAHQAKAAEELTSMAPSEAGARRGNSSTASLRLRSSAQQQVSASSAFRYRRKRGPPDEVGPDADATTAASSSIGDGLGGWARDDAFSWQSNEYGEGRGWREGLGARYDDRGPLRNRAFDGDPLTAEPKPLLGQLLLRLVTLPFDTSHLTLTVPPDELGAAELLTHFVPLEELRQRAVGSGFWRVGSTRPGRLYQHQPQQEQHARARPPQPSETRVKVAPASRPGTPISSPQPLRTRTAAPSLASSESPRLPSSAAVAAPAAAGSDTAGANTGAGPAGGGAPFPHLDLSPCDVALLRQALHTLATASHVPHFVAELPHPLLRAVGATDHLLPNEGDGGTVAGAGVAGLTIPLPHVYGRHWFPALDGLPQFGEERAASPGSGAHGAHARNLTLQYSYLKKKKRITSNKVMAIRKFYNFIRDGRRFPDPSSSVQHEGALPVDGGGKGPIRESRGAAHCGAASFLPGLPLWAWHTASFLQHEEWARRYFNVARTPPYPWVMRLLCPLLRQSTHASLGAADASLQPLLLAPAPTGGGATTGPPIPAPAPSSMPPLADGTSSDGDANGGASDDGCDSESAAVVRPVMGTFQYDVLGLVSALHTVLSAALTDAGQRVLRSSAPALDAGRTPAAPAAAPSTRAAQPPSSSSAPHAGESSSRSGDGAAAAAAADEDENGRETFVRMMERSSRMSFVLQHTLAGGTYRSRAQRDQPHLLPPSPQGSGDEGDGKGGGAARRGPRGAGSDSSSEEDSSDEGGKAEAEEEAEEQQLPFYTPAWRRLVAERVDLTFGFAAPLSPSASSSVAAGVIRERGSSSSSTGGGLSRDGWRGWLGAGADAGLEEEEEDGEGTALPQGVRECLASHRAALLAAAAASSKSSSLPVGPHVAVWYTLELGPPGPASSSSGISSNSSSAAGSRLRPSLVLPLAIPSVKIAFELVPPQAELVPPPALLEALQAAPPLDRRRFALNARPSPAGSRLHSPDTAATHRQQHPHRGHGGNLDGYLDGGDVGGPLGAAGHPDHEYFANAATQHPMAAGGGWHYGPLRIPSLPSMWRSALLAQAGWTVVPLRLRDFAWRRAAAPGSAAGSAGLVLGWHGTGSDDDDADAPTPAAAGGRRSAGAGGGRCKEDTGRGATARPPPRDPGLKLELELPVEPDPEGEVHRLLASVVRTLVDSLPDAALHRRYLQQQAAAASGSPGPGGRARSRPPG